MTHPIFARIDSALDDVEPAAVIARADPDEHEAIAWAPESKVTGSRVFYNGVLINRVREGGWSVDWTPPEDPYPRDPETGRFISRGAE